MGWLLWRTLLGDAAIADRSGRTCFAWKAAGAGGLDDLIEGLSLRIRWMKKAAAMPRMIGTTSIDSLLVHARAVLARQVSLAMVPS